MAMGAKAKVAAIISAGILLAIGYPGFMYYESRIKATREWNPQAFNQNLWIKGTQDERGSMVLDLCGYTGRNFLSKNLLSTESRLYNLDRTAVRGLLGSPDRAREDHDSFQLGSMYFNPNSIRFSFAGGNKFTLWIDYDENGTVNALQIVQ